MTNSKEYSIVKRLVDNKQIMLSTDEEGVVIGSDRWVYSCAVCGELIGKKSDKIHKHFIKNHAEILAMMGLAGL